MSEHRACEECIRLLEQVTSFVPSAAMDIDWDVGEAGYSEDFAYVIEQARAHLAVHADRTCIHSYHLECACGETGCTKLACLYCMQHKPCEVCDGSGIYVHYNRRGIGFPQPCRCQEVK